MKKVLVIVMILLTFSCSKDENRNDNNPNLINPLVSLTLNLNLPQYNALNFAGNSIIINQQGIKGIVVYNVNNEIYTAFELSDPNHLPSECSRMMIDGIVAKCPCQSDDNEYNIVTGKHRSQPNFYPMQQYFTERTGDNLRINN